MKYLISILIIAMTQISMAQSNVTKEQIAKFKETITANGYFKYVDNSKEIDVWGQLQDEGLMGSGWIIFPNKSRIIQEQTGKFQKGEYRSFDYRTIMVDADYMFRGGMEYYLKQATQIFEIRGLKFDVRDEKMEWGENDQEKGYHYFKHVVYVNDKLITIADGNLNRMGGNMYFKKYLEMIKNELLNQGSSEEIRLVSYEDGVVMLIGEMDLLTAYDKAITPFKNVMIKE